MPINAIAQSTAAQYERAFRSLKDAIGNCPDAEWRRADVPFLMPARQAYHALQACDAYCRADPDTFVHHPIGPGGLGDEFERVAPADQPTREAMLGYLERTAANVRRWLLEQSDQTMLGAEPRYPYTGSTLLERTIYALRHLQHHLGQINSELRRRGLPRGKWC